MTNPIRLATIGCLAAAIAIGATGCRQIDDVHEAVYGDYHRLSPAYPGVNITIKRHATNAMVDGFHGCQGGSELSDAACGTAVLQAARSQLNGRLHGAALEVWNGDYSVFGYHPNLGKGFRDGEGGDLADAVANLERRNQECLRVTWRRTGTNWTTTNDEGVAECSWGRRLLPG